MHSFCQPAFVWVCHSYTLLLVFFLYFVLFRCQLVRHNVILGYNNQTCSCSLHYALCYININNVDGCAMSSDSVVHWSTEYCSKRSTLKFRSGCLTMRLRQEASNQCYVTAGRTLGLEKIGRSSGGFREE